jgi:hypothetical protein
MSVTNKKKHGDYTRFAAYCLHLKAPPTDTDADLIEHEMALEWLKLADAELVD